MGRYRFVLVGLLIAAQLHLSTAQALPSWAVGAQKTAQAVGTAATATEITNVIKSGIKYRRTITLGSVGYGLFIGAALINVALAWFYAQAENAAGGLDPDLDCQYIQKNCTKLARIEYRSRAVYGTVTNYTAYRVSLGWSGAGTKTIQAPSGKSNFEALDLFKDEVNSALSAMPPGYVKTSDWIVGPCGSYADCVYVEGYLSLQQRAELGQVPVSAINSAISAYTSNNEPTRYSPYSGVTWEDAVPTADEWTGASSLDSDNDGYTDDEETKAGTDPNNPNSYPGHNPGQDSDGDGYTDDEENRVGTDPNNPNSHPSGPPDDDGDGYTNDEEVRKGTDPRNPNSHPDTRPDNDGDGYSNDQEDRAGTDKNDPNSRPDEAPDNPAEEDPAGEDFKCAIDSPACEATLRDIKSIEEQNKANTARIATATEATETETRKQTSFMQEIRDFLKGDENIAPPEPAVLPDVPVTDTGELAAVEPDVSVLEVKHQEIIDGIAAQVESVHAAALTKFPFGMANMANAAIPTGGVTASCPAVSFAILGKTSSVSICDNPIDEFATTTGKTLMGVVFTLGLVMALWKIAVTA